MDELSTRIHSEALEMLEAEPELCTLLHRTVLAPGVETFEDAVASTICYRLLLHPCDNASMGRDDGNCPQSNGLKAKHLHDSSSPMFCPDSLRDILSNAMKSPELELGHTMSEAVRQDALAVIERDPATETLLEVILFFKGYAALVCHRAARRKWNEQQASPKKRRSFVALFLQSQASAVFGLDIHPAATMGCGILLDHGTGVVIGETAYVGDGTTMLHGVTLGGTGKQNGDRHPKVGKDVLIGANASILGNVKIGDGAKIGAGSVVLRPIPPGATAVGAPAKIIGRAKESNPGSIIDETFQNVELLHRSESVLRNMNQQMYAIHNNGKKPASTTAKPSNDPMNTIKKSDSVSTATTLGTSFDYTTAGSLTDNLHLVTKSQSENPLPFITIEDDDNDSFASALETADDEEDELCPYRDYVKIAKDAPKNGITILTLRKLLIPEGYTPCQIGGIFFALDIKNVGYVHVEEFLKHYEEVFDLYGLPSKPVRRIITNHFKNCNNTTVATAPTPKNTSQKKGTSWW